MHPAAPVETEFRIEQSGLRFERGSLRYAWFRLADREQGSRLRAVCLRELTYLPIETRADPDLRLGRRLRPLTANAQTVSQPRWINRWLSSARASLDNASSA